VKEHHWCACAAGVDAPEIDTWQLDDLTGHANMVQRPYVPLIPYVIHLLCAQR
jgi:hypothetical protein